MDDSRLELHMSLYPEVDWWRWVKKRAYQLYLNLTDCGTVCLLLDADSRAERPWIPS
jgi:hypothetical protein